jgi:hypothetical protein
MLAATLLQVTNLANSAILKMHAVFVSEKFATFYRTTQSYILDNNNNTFFSFGSTAQFRPSPLP